MSLPALRTLLRRMDGDTHAGRCRTIADLALAHRGDASAAGAFAGLLDGLEHTSAYHARLVTIGAQIIGDVERLYRLARHPSPAVARGATRRLPLAAVDRDDAVALYLDASAATRRTIRRRLVAARRSDVIDRLITHGRLADRERAGLLPGASDAVVRDHLADLAGLAPIGDALAERHPGPLLDLLVDRTSGTTLPERESWWQRLGGVLGTFARHDPDRLLTVLATRGDGLPPGLHRGLGTLIRHDPARTAALVLATPREDAWAVGRALVREARRFSERDRHAIARYLREAGWHPDWQDSLLATYLTGLAPSLRAATFAAAYEGVSTADRELADDLLDALPHEERHRQARRMLGLRSVVDRVDRSAHISGYLPADAADRLAPVTHSSVAEERAAAHAARLAAAGRSRDARTVSVALARLDELRNEQDPVRAAAAATLATMPVKPLLHADLEGVARFTLEVVTARDTSATTLASLVTTWWRITLAALAADNTDIARRALGLLIDLRGAHGWLTVPSLTGLPRGAERPVIDALVDALRAGQRRDEPHLLFGLCRALGDRAHAHQDLQGMLKEALHSPDAGVVHTAAELWLDDPRTRPQRVDIALRIDESLAVLPLVQRTLSRSRQDLLGVLWRPTSLRGRLWGRRMRFVPVLDGSFDRWLPRQVDEYAAALGDLIGTPDTPTWTRTAAVHTLGRLPQIGSGALEAFLTSGDVALEEAALGALAHTDRPGDALTRLLAIRTDDRTRVAMYAAGRCARHLPEARVWPAVIEVLDDPAARVSARKEAVRLLGALRAPEAIDRVVAVGLHEDTHRDVRGAAARALLAHLDDPRAWTVLEQIAASGRDGALAVLQPEPGLMAERHRTAYGALVARHVGSCGDATASILRAWVGRLPDAGTLLTGMLCDFTRSDWHGTLAALRALLLHERGWPQVLAAAEAMADAAENPTGTVDDDGRRRDLPLRRRLEGLVTTVTDWTDRELPRQVHDARRLVDILAARPDTRGMALRAGARIVDWSDPGDALGELAVMADDPMRVGDLRDAIAHALTQRTGDPAPPLLTAVDRLIDDGAAPASVTALEVVAWAGGRSGWAEPWRTRLTVLRNHPSPVIASWAHDVATTPE